MKSKHLLNNSVIRGLRLVSIMAIAALLSSCDNSAGIAPVFHEQDNPVRLSDWQLFSRSGDKFQVNDASEVFKPSNTLFTDYAHKLRTLWLPETETIGLKDEELSYPVGTILSKTFYYPIDAAGQVLKQSDNNSAEINLANNRLIETRLLVKRSNGWAAFPYVWNDEQTEAFLRVAGATQSLSLIDTSDSNNNQEFQYFVPNENQCAGCHVTEHPDGPLRPLGAKASQLAAFAPILVQRAWMSAADTAAMANLARPDWQDETLSPTIRVVEYLNIHCGHCHNPNGAADTSGLNLDGSHTSLTEIGLCKPPVAAGSGAGDLRYGIVPGAAGESILSYRLGSVDPAVMMPELGRSLAHSEGLELVNDWIASLSGNCLGQ